MKINHKEKPNNKTIIEALKNDCERSYFEFYQNYKETLEKREMFYYWKGFFHAVFLCYGIKEETLDKFLKNLFFKKKKNFFSNKTHYELK